MEFIEQTPATLDFSRVMPPDNEPDNTPAPDPQKEENDKMEAMMQSVAQLAKKIESKKEISALVKAVSGLSDLIKQLLDSHEDTNKLLGKIADKEIEFPDPPKFPEFPKIPEVKIPETVSVSNLPIDRTDEIIMAIKDAIQPLIEQNETEIALMKENLKKEVVEGKEEPKFTDKVGSIRRAHKWVRASTADGNIVGTIDGTNTDFYLPWAPMINSETIRLNQGIPLSQGVDYSLASNKISFVIAPPSGSQIEVRAQT